MLSLKPRLAVRGTKCRFYLFPRTACSPRLAPHVFYRRDVSGYSWRFNDQNPTTQAPHSRSHHDSEQMHPPPPPPEGHHNHHHYESEADSVHRSNQLSGLVCFSCFLLTIPYTLAHPIVFLALPIAAVAPFTGDALRPMFGEAVSALRACSRWYARHKPREDEMHNLHQQPHSRHFHRSRSGSDASEDSQDSEGEQDVPNYSAHRSHRNHHSRRSHSSIDGGSQQHMLALLNSRDSGHQQNEEGATISDIVGALSRMASRIQEDSQPYNPPLAHQQVHVFVEQPPPEMRFDPVSPRDSIDNFDAPTNPDSHQPIQHLNHSPASRHGVNRDTPWHARPHDRPPPFEHPTGVPEVHTAFSNMSSDSQPGSSLNGFDQPDNYLQQRWHASERTPNSSSDQGTQQGGPSNYVSSTDGHNLHPQGEQAPAHPQDSLGSFDSPEHAPSYNFNYPNYQVWGFDGATGYHSSHRHRSMHYSKSSRERVLSNEEFASGASGDHSSKHQPENTPNNDFLDFSSEESLEGHTCQLPARLQKPRLESTRRRCRSFDAGGRLHGHIKSPEQAIYVYDGDVEMQ